MNVMSHITLNHRQMDFTKAANCKFTASHVLEPMALFSFFAIKNSLNFAGSVLGQMFACKKDIFYRFLLFTDEKTQTFVDVTLQGEMGKKPATPQGLSQKMLDASSKKRDTDSRAAKRSEEYFQSMMDNPIRMVNRNIFEGIRFDYLLVDSWFTCKELVKFIRSRHIGCHLLGMIKMSKTKYDTTDGAMTANAIIAGEFKRKGHVKYSKHYRFYYCEVAAIFAETPVILFFYRNGKKGDWNALLSTNTALNACEAYKIYSMRWGIKVLFAEAFPFDQDEMMRSIINNNNKELNAVRIAFEALQAVA